MPVYTLLVLFLWRTPRNTDCLGVQVYTVKHEEIHGNGEYQVQDNGSTLGVEVRSGSCSGERVLGTLAILIRFDFLSRIVGT